jgi:hypothetical protein
MTLLVISGCAKLVVANLMLQPMLQGCYIVISIPFCTFAAALGVTCAQLTAQHLNPGQGACRVVLHASLHTSSCLDQTIQCTESMDQWNHSTFLRPK